MKKQELIHLHGLLAQLEDNYEEETGDIIEHEEYNTLKTRPTSIHKSKTDHKIAVLALANDITEGLGPKLEFDDEVLLTGLLESKTEDESKLASIFAHLAKESPGTVLSYVPILLSFIRNGDITTQRYAVQAVEDLADVYPKKVNRYSDEFIQVSEEIYEFNLRNDLQSTIDKIRAQVAENNRS